MEISRRALFKSVAAAAGVAAASRLGASAQADPPERSALVVVYLQGGYNAIFTSSDALNGVYFGATQANAVRVGTSDLVVDRKLEPLLAPCGSRMAAIGLKHGQAAHDQAQLAAWSDGKRSYALKLASLLGGTAAIKAANVGEILPPGPLPSEAGVPLEAIRDLDSTIAALGGKPDTPNRTVVAAALEASETMSRAHFDKNSRALVTMKDGMRTAIATQRQGKQFSYAEVAQAYGVGPTTTRVRGFAMQMLAAELMITAGANVVTAMDEFRWDTHFDNDGTQVRGLMETAIVPALRTFLTRMMAQPSLNVVVCMLGDFARSRDDSGHATGVSATVMGKYVRAGTTGKVDANVALPQGTPSGEALWAYLAKTVRVPGQPFGAHMFHDQLVT